MTTQPLTDEQYAAIRQRETAATPGPWYWRGNTDSRDLRLQTPKHGGLTVMDFTRWGMQSARPRFGRDMIMNDADEMVVYEVAAWSKDIYRKDVVGIDHPDAEFIAHARDDMPALLAEVDRLRAVEAGAATLADDHEVVTTEVARQHAEILSRMQAGAIQSERLDELVDVQERLHAAEAEIEENASAMRALRRQRDEAGAEHDRVRAALTEALQVLDDGPQWVNDQVLQHWSVPAARAAEVLRVALDTASRES